MQDELLYCISWGAVARHLFTVWHHANVGPTYDWIEELQCYANDNTQCRYRNYCRLFGFFDTDQDCTC